MSRTFDEWKVQLEPALTGKDGYGRFASLVEMLESWSDERAKLREAVGELTKYPTITGSVMSSSVVDCYLVSDIATIFDKEG
jgi:hypothetical protein